MKPSLVAGMSVLHRRSRYLSATALVRAGAWGAVPAGLVFLPAALVPSVAGAATIAIPATCVTTGPGVCNAQVLLASPGVGTDTIAFQGGVLTLNGLGLSYSQKATLGTTPTNVLNQDGHDTTFNGVFSGKGDIAIANTGTGGSVTLNAANTYAGSTTVNPGATLKLGTVGKIASSSGLADNGAFDISGAGTNVTINDLSGSGTVNLGANSLTLGPVNSTFAGGIAGSGGMTVSGKGTETLSGAITYTGITTITGNATLSITGAGNIASSSKVADAGVFDIASASGNVTINTLSGAGAVNLGSNSVILSKASDTFSGAISGKGGVTIAAGSETFSSAAPKTYSGTTTINTGATLVLSGAGGIANSSVADNGAFDISNASTPGPSITSLSGSGSVTLGSRVLTLSNASGIFTGVIGSGGSGTSSNGLVVAKGAEALMGKNTFLGTTTVSSAATLTGTGSVAGDLANNGTVRPFNSTTPLGTPGALTVGGNYSQAATGSLKIAIGGTAPGTFGRLLVAGTVALAGGLDVDLVNGFLFPQGTSTYDILHYNLGKRTNLTGDFLAVSFNENACALSGTDTWRCGAGLSFTESFATLGQLQLVVSETPEPATLAILATGLLSLLGLRRRRRA